LNNYLDKLNKLSYLNVEMVEIEDISVFKELD